MIDLEAIEARCNAATPGPWGYEFNVGKKYYINTPEYCKRDYCCLAGDLEHKADAAFIAAAREDIPALIARIRELEAKLSTAECYLDMVEDEAVKEHWYDIGPLIDEWRGLKGESK